MPGSQFRSVVASIALGAAIAIAAIAVEPSVNRASAVSASAPQLRFIRVDRDLTLSPRGVVVTTLLCPRSHFMLTWGFRPIGPTQAGIVANAILLEAVPVLRNGGGSAGFRFRFSNPNAGATTHMRVSVSCVGGRGIRTAVDRRSPLFGGAGGSRRGAQASGTRIPSLTLTGVRRRVRLAAPSGQARASVAGDTTMLCPRGSLAADFGFKVEQGRVQRVEHVKRAGRAGLQVFFRGFGTTPEQADVYALCVRPQVGSPPAALRLRLLRFRGNSQSLGPTLPQGQVEVGCARGHPWTFAFPEQRGSGVAALMLERSLAPLRTPGVALPSISRYRFLRSNLTGSPGSASVTCVDSTGITIDGLDPDPGA